ncbi:hypothetical protein MHYP_G00090900 [Metynnis hypsauchen]
MEEGESERQDKMQGSDNERERRAPEPSPTSPVGLVHMMCPSPGVRCQCSQCERDAGSEQKSLDMTSNNEGNNLTQEETPLDHPPERTAPPRPSTSGEAAPTLQAQENAGLKIKTELLEERVASLEKDKVYLQQRLADVLKPEDAVSPVTEFF